jgi:hypothetical protein
MAEKITQKLYDGSVTLDFYPKSHWYKMAGERTYLVSVTGATGIIDKSRALIIWATRLAGDHMRQYLEENAGQKFTAEELYPVIDEAIKQHELAKTKAGSIGDEVHDWAEQFAKFKSGQSENCPEITKEMKPEVINGINAFIDWFNSNDVKFIDAERLLYSKKHVYAGFCDAIATVNGEKLLIDYKTGKAIYSEAHYQVSGYVLAYEEETGEKLAGAMILNFNKETGEMNDWQKIGREDLKIDGEVFLHCLGIKKREKELTKWGN